MQTIDFGAAFETGETSGRILNLDIVNDPKEVLLFWNKESSWAKCEFVQHDGNDRLKVIINTSGLAPGNYQDILSVIQDSQQDTFLVKFCVIPVNVKKRESMSPTPKSDSLPPRFLAVPPEINLGQIDIGEKISCSLLFLNMGGPVWSRPTFSWSDGAYWHIDTAKKPEAHNGQLFPIKFDFTVDTTKCDDGGNYGFTLTLKTDGASLVVPVRFCTVKRVEPTLHFSDSRIYCELNSGSQSDVVMSIGKTGSSLLSFKYCWGNDKYDWHSSITVTPTELNGFPKHMTFKLDAKRAAPGDYMDTITISIGDYHPYTIPVQVRVLPNSE